MLNVNDTKYEQKYKMEQGKRKTCPHFTLQCFKMNQKLF